MTRDELIQRAKAILAEAYEAAAEMIVLYLEKHPSEQLKPLCREIDPDNWAALEARVRRAKIRNASGDADSSASRRDRLYRTKSAVKQASPEELAELLDTPEVRANVSKALDRHYRQRATEAVAKRRERDVEDIGGAEAHAEHVRGQRIAEVVNVMRGVVSGLRFAASQTRELDLNPEAEAEEIARLADEASGFADMLRASLSGEPITDDDLARLVEDR